MGDFSFDLKEESEDECLTKRGREFRSSGAQAQCIERIPRVFLPIPGKRKMRASADERRQREGG